MREFDLVVLGGGSGGIATANRAASYGAKVAVIEAKDLGGTCVNLGCVPKKITWYAARVSEAIHHYGKGYGFTAENVTFDYETFLKARDGYIERSRTSYTNVFAKNNVEVIQGYGKFISNHEIEVNGEVIRGNYFMIATGGFPAKPQVSGIELTDTSDDFFAWTELPQSVAVVGAGYIAVELAGVLHALGVETHLVVRQDRPLRKFDEMVTDGLLEAIERSGMHLHTYTDFDAYVQNGSQIDCYQNGELKLTVDKVVVAIGRDVQTSTIGLENTDVQLNKNGTIQVNDAHQTAVPHIYAVGDVIGKVDLTPVAIKAGRQVAEYLFNGAPTSAIDYTCIPTVVFSHPAIGTIGLTEKEAIAQYGAENIKVYQSKFFAMYASAAWHREPCYFKLVCLGEEERVIGLHGIGEGVDEMIQGFGVAMKMGATKQQFDAVVAIHPTGSEEFVTMR
ncbi:MAG: glutathione-disulfide reductase [Aerococcaceae bacterium]|nr:glutathione-disulfide reductase [Aerococcaceae bacterium]